MGQLVTFLLLAVTFPYWFPVVGAFFIGIGLLWIISYPIACTVHQIYVRAVHGKWVQWNMLEPKSGEG